MSGLIRINNATRPRRCPLCHTENSFTDNGSNWLCNIRECRHVVPKTPSGHISAPPSGRSPNATRRPERTPLARHIPQRRRGNPARTAMLWTSLATAIMLIAFFGIRGMLGDTNNDNYSIIEQELPVIATPAPTPMPAPTPTPTPTPIPEPILIPSVLWSWSDYRVHFGDWRIGVQLLDQPIVNCIQFTLDYEFREVRSGNPYGRQSIYILSGGRWIEVGSLYAVDNNRVTATIELATPTTFSAIAVVPMPNASGNFSDWFAPRDFIIDNEAVVPTPIEVVIPINQWSWSEYQVDFDEWQVGVQLFTEPIVNCVHFTLAFEFREVTDGDPYGQQNIFILSEGAWVKVGNLYAPDDDQIVVTIDLGTPTTFNGIAVVPSTASPDRISFSNWFSPRDFIVIP